MKIRINLTIDAHVLDRIDEAAKTRGLSRSAFMTTAALETAERVTSKEPKQ